MLDANTLPDGLSSIPLYGDYPVGIALSDPSGLQQLPILDKQQLSGRFPRIWMNDTLKQAIADDAVEYAATSGTSGDRLQIVRARNWWQSEYARTYRHHPDLASFDPAKTRKAILTTSVCSSAVCWRTNPTYEQRILETTLYLNSAPDPNRWTLADVAQMIAEIDLWQPEYIDMHASYGAILARKAAEFGLPPPNHKPRLITISYDFCPARARQAVGAFFGAPTYELFGATEFGYAYIETQHGLQPVEDDSVLELLPLEGRPDLRRLVITTLKNPLMPLIRYNTGDLFTVDSATGLPQKIAGRQKDCILDDAGHPVAPIDIDRALEATGHAPADYQLRCGTDDTVLLAVGAERDDTLTDALIALLGPSRRIGLQHVREIAPEASGKFSRIKKV